jgi:hypothetical protein
MLLTEPTPKMIDEWKSTFEQYKTRLQPNKKSASEVLEYLKQKYPLVEMPPECAELIVIDNIMMNQCFAEKVSPDSELKVQVFTVKNTGTGKVLYIQQDEVFQGCDIIIGIEFETSFIMVEGSSFLKDELVAFQGLDAADLTNFYIVAEYISCLKKFNMLYDVLT